MSDQPKCKWTIGAYSIGIIGGFLLVSGLLWLMRDYTPQPAPLGEDRAQARRKALHDVRAADAEALGNTNYVWLDQNKGIVRLPLNQAMELSVRLWQHPAEARSNLASRAAKAFYVPPPPPNKFD